MVAANRHQTAIAKANGFLRVICFFFFNNRNKFAVFFNQTAIAIRVFRTETHHHHIGTLAQASACLLQGLRLDQRCIAKNNQHVVIAACNRLACSQNRMRSAQTLDLLIRRNISSDFLNCATHGIGTTTHEPPYMVEGEDRPIEPGMCFSVEPGVYLPGRFGVRIEDIVVAFPPDVPDGARRLNTSTHDLQTVR